MYGVRARFFWVYVRTGDILPPIEKAIVHLIGLTRDSPTSVLHGGIRNPDSVARLLPDC